jgi:hypothetical protein
MIAGYCYVENGEDRGGEKNIQEFFSMQPLRKIFK